jgi:fermentation-respiration switch protein FrsA (DUF1100 family)
MVELTTYLYPAIQGLFCLVIAAVWLVGFLRQRNFGFLLLTLATLAEGVTSLVRQALFNYVIYHEPHLSAAERSTTVGMIGMTVLGVYVVFWLATALGALLIVLHRSKYQTPVEGIPPASG